VCTAKKKEWKVRFGSVGRATGAGHRIKAKLRARDFSRARQTEDKTNEFRQFDESFGQAFLKACAVEGA
jgi:hypothetical protein